MKYRVTSKESGMVLFDGEALSAEDAILRAEADMGPLPVNIYDDQLARPEWRAFASMADALKVFVPEACAHIETDADNH
jgi:hypothetical protein